MWLKVSQMFLLAVVVNSKLDMRMARCRADCVYKVTMPEATETSCRKSSNCSQCWSTCLRLQTLGYSDTICGNQNCDVGCSTACQWWSLQHPISGTYLSLRIPWAPAEGTWPLDSTRAPQGLHKKHLAQAKTVIRSLGLDDAIRLADSLNMSIDHSWRVALVSMYHQPELVSAEISWKTDKRKQQSADCQAAFLVTWSVEGGVVRGNLVTNASTAVLSLWPDTVYRVQVTTLSCSSAGRQSASILVDTRRAPESRRVVPQAQGSVPQSGVPQGSVLQFSGVPQRSVLAGVAAAAVLLVALALAFTWKTHHSMGLPHSKLIDDDVSTPNLYRVFPPAVRLVTESNVKQEIFSSTDNLLQAVNFKK